ncbi:MAG: hypothetical protein ABJB85_09280 [Nitrososphaerota archaeon]
MANDVIVSGQGSDQISAELGDDKIYQRPKAVQFQNIETYGGETC